MVIIGKKKKEVFQTMLDFVEGRITVYEFWDMFNEKEEYSYYLMKRKKYFWSHQREKFIHPQKIDLNKLHERVELYWLIKRYLELFHIKFNAKNEDEERMEFLEKLCPVWFDISDSEWFEETLGIKNKPINEMGSIKSLREKVRSLFKYQKRPPIWVQGAYWPIIDGIPAEFIRQSSNPGSKDWLEEPVDYYFKDHNGKEIIINQLP